NGVVDDLEHAAADQLLVLDQCDVRSDTGGVEVEHEADGAGRCDDRDLAVAVAVPRTQLVGLVPGGPGGGEQVRIDGGGGDRVGGLTVLGHDPEHRLAVDRVAVKGAHLAGDPGRLGVPLAGEDGGQAGGEIAALRGVVGDA